MKIDLWPIFWAVLAISIASCQAVTTMSYNDCVVAGGTNCSNR